MEQAREQQHVQGHMLLRTKFDLAVAVLLGLTVMAIAWGAYRAEVNSKNARALLQPLRRDARDAPHKLELQGDQEAATYEQLFLDYEQAKAEGRTKAAAYLRRRLITPDLMGAISWWERQPSVTRPPTPFVDGNPGYHNVYYHRAKQFEGQASLYLDKAHKAEEHMIDYTIVSVLLTVALFLLGLSTQLATAWVRFGLLAFGTIILLASIGRFVDLASWSRRAAARRRGGSSPWPARARRRRGTRAGSRGRPRRRPAFRSSAYLRKGNATQSARREASEEVVAPVQKALEEIERRGHLRAELGDPRLVGRWAPAAPPRSRSVAPSRRG